MQTPLMMNALTQLHGKIRLMTLERKRMRAFNAGKFDAVRVIAAEEDRVRNALAHAKETRH